MSEKEVMRLVTSHRDHYQMSLHITHSGLMREPDAHISKRFAMENVVTLLYQIVERVTVAMADPLNQGIMLRWKKRRRDTLSWLTNLTWRPINKRRTF
ncbi:MAG: hypothetical protein HQK86_14565 [Nitrospinae bacterium]|nr:hypothetical protein [Nitrospinota bacterium]